MNSNFLPALFFFTTPLLLKVEKAKRKERRRRNCVKDLHNIKFYITLLILVVFQILTLTRTKAARFFLSSSLPYNRALENSLTITWCFYHLEFLKKPRALLSLSTRTTIITTVLQFVLFFLNIETIGSACLVCSTCLCVENFTSSVGVFAP